MHLWSESLRADQTFASTWEDGAIHINFETSCMTIAGGRGKHSGGDAAVVWYITC